MTSEEKVKKFMDEYQALVKKYNVDFGAFPQFMPDGKGAFNVVVHSEPIDIDDFKKKQNDFIQKA